MSKSTMGTVEGGMMRENISVRLGILKFAATVLFMLGAQASVLASEKKQEWMYLLGGTCALMVLEETDHANECKGYLAQTADQLTGRIGFAVSLSTGSSITFSGLNGPNPDENTGTVNLDTVIIDLGINGIDKTQYSAVGKCTYKNPYAGQAIVICNANHSGKNRVSFEFITDGDEPSRIVGGEIEPVNNLLDLGLIEPTVETNPRGDVTGEAVEISKCFLSVDHEIYIHGPCEFVAMAGGSFQIFSSSGLGAYVQLRDRGAIGFWNSEDDPDRDLGQLRRDGACWTNERAKICAYR